MAEKLVIDLNTLFALNADFAEAVARCEPWAMRHLQICQSINRGEPEGYRRPFDGKPRKWCGDACPFDEGCVSCTLPENPRVARENRERKARKTPEELARSGIIVVEGEVNDEMEKRVREYIALAEESGITRLEVRIESHGGHTANCVHIYDALLQAYGVSSRVGVVMSHAYSAGLIILQACEHRVGGREAQFLMHHGRYDKITIPQLRNQLTVKWLLAMAEPDEQRVNEICVARTKRSLEEVLAQNDKDEYMTSEEALAFGLIDEIR